MSWEETGNANTNPDINFLGTTDQQPVVVRTNNIEALRVDPTGNVGIGTTSPTDTLHVSKTGAGGISIQSTTQSDITFMDKDGKPGWVLGRSQSSDDANTFFLFDAVNKEFRMTVSRSGFVKFFTRHLETSARLSCKELTVLGTPGEGAPGIGRISCQELFVNGVQVTGDISQQNQINQLQTRVDQLKATVGTLEGRVGALEKLVSALANQVAGLAALSHFH